MYKYGTRNMVQGVTLVVYGYGARNMVVVCGYGTRSICCSV